MPEVVKTLTSRRVPTSVTLVPMPRDPTDDAPLSRQLWPADLAAEPFAAVFRKHFAALKAAHQAQPHEGVLIAAVDGNGFFDGHAHLRLPTSGIAHLINWLGTDTCDATIGVSAAVKSPIAVLQLRGN